MSKTIMAEVAAQSQARGSARSVLLEIAFYARDDGTHAFPSMERLADRTGLSLRHVQRVIIALEKDGHIRVFRDKSVRKRPRNFYHVLRPWRTVQTFTAQMIIDKDHKEPAQMIMDTMSMDLKPNTSERETHARPPEDEDTQHAIRDEIRNQEWTLQHCLTLGSPVYAITQARITSLRRLLGENDAQETCPQEAEEALVSRIKT